MARLNPQITSSESEPDSEAGAQSPPRNTAQSSPSPVISVSSNKENESRSTRPSLGPDNRKDSVGKMSSNKRRRLTDRTHSLPSQAARQREIEERVDTQYYDPDQDEDERRNTRKGMRDLAKDLNDSRTEYLQSDSRGLVNTLKKADEYFKKVKQTSDATIDSRLLVTAADLSYKKTNEMALGDSSTGVDVDEFVSKCITFMRKSMEAEIRRDRLGSVEPGRSSTQTQRRRGLGISQEEEDETGDPLDWAYLGRNACFLHNSRPCLSGFLLGPLSAQKRVRKQTQRRAREARQKPENALRPQELGAEDMEKQETANLTVICSDIRILLRRIQEEGEAACEAEYNRNEEMTEEESQDLMRAHGIADNGQVPLFDFCVNPQSFGQTVENLFYVSFLVKEGGVGLGLDSKGLPTLGLAEQRTVAQRQEAPKNQAVFTLDFQMWEDIIDSYGIRASLIPHRVEEEYDDGTNGNGGANGWYE